MKLLEYSYFWNKMSTWANRVDAVLSIKYIPHLKANTILRLCKRGAKARNSYSEKRKKVKISYLYVSFIQHDFLHWHFFYRCTELERYK